MNNNVVEEEKRVLVPVVYYLSRNGQLQHPHFIEVPLSSPHGLFLRDVVHRLHLLRGQSMASHYSWSSKRCYKNGYVWHDLEENDLIHPVLDGEYILKGSEIIEPTSFSPGKSSFSSVKSNIIIAPPTAKNRPKNQSWGAIDLNEYKVYKSSTESTHESAAAAAAADASTQTDDKHRRISKIQEISEEKNREKTEQCSTSTTELSRGEISPPPSDSSPETLAINEGRDCVRTTGNSNYPSGRMMKASSVLMSLISCGSVSFRDCGATAVKDHGLSLITRPPRGGIKADNDGMVAMEKNVSSSFAKMALEDKEYFSGSIIESSNSNKSNYKDDYQIISLKRSSSYNSERSSHLKLEGKKRKD